MKTSQLMNRVYTGLTYTAMHVSAFWLQVKYIQISLIDTYPLLRLTLTGIVATLGLTPQDPKNFCAKSIYDISKSRFRRWPMCWSGTRQIL